MSATNTLPLPIIERVTGQVNRSETEILRFLQDLVRFKTPSQDPENQKFPEGIRGIHAHIGEFLERHSFSLDSWLAPPMSFDEHPILVGTLRGSGGGNSIALNGHVDVTPTGDTSAWDHDPWSGDLQDGKVWGRGTCDMKGGVTAMIYAVKILQDCGFRLKGDVFVHIVSDEEVVGFGSRECAEKAERPDFLIVTEPTRLDVLPVEGGLEHMRIEISGREEHAGRRFASIYPQDVDKGHGANAVEKGLKIVQALQELERSWSVSKSHPLLPPGFNTLLPGILIGGPGGGQDGKLNIHSNPGTTPNYCSIEYNIWYYPHEHFEDIKRDVEACVMAVAKHDPWLKDNPPTFTWHLRNISFPPANTDPEHPGVKHLEGFLEYLGHSPQVKGFTAAADLAWYAEKGIPGIIFGPGDIANAHSPNEFVPISDMLDTTKAMALTLLAWCGYEESAP